MSTTDSTTTRSHCNAMNSTTMNPSPMGSLINEAKKTGSRMASNSRASTWYRLAGFAASRVRLNTELMASSELASVRMSRFLRENVKNS